MHPYASLLFFIVPLIYHYAVTESVFQVSVEEVSNGFVQVNARLLTTDTVLLARVIHSFKRDGQVLKVLV